LGKKCKNRVAPGGLAQWFQELCWHHPKLWGLLPEKTDPQPKVPDWPQFLRGCVRYRQSLDEQLPDAPRTKDEFE
jgi:hypothetical protein